MSGVSADESEEKPRSLELRLRAPSLLCEVSVGRGAAPGEQPEQQRGGEAGQVRAEHSGNK